MKIYSELNLLLTEEFFCSKYIRTANKYTFVAVKTNSSHVVDIEKLF